MAKNNPLGFFKAWRSEKDTILKEIKKSKGIIYGQQSIRKRTGLFSRPTRDYDVLSKNPQKLIKNIEKKLDRKSGNKNIYFSRPAMHPGTFTLVHYGRDGIQNTKDDIGLCDATLISKSNPAPLALTLISFILLVLYNFAPIISLNFFL